MTRARLRGVGCARRRGGAAAALLALVLAGCGHDDRPAPPTAGADVHPALAAHTAEFEPRVYTVVPGVHVAVGFALGNAILLEGDGCNVVVDVTESVESARRIKAEFDRLSARPVGALVYTHNHADHVFGARGFVDADVPVYAHETTADHIAQTVSVVRPVVGVRSLRMFGTALPAAGPDRIVNAGIGPALALGHDAGTTSLMLPTETVRDALDARPCGIPMRLVHAPGETADQLFVWLPDRHVLLPGDNVYKAFPNLYTIRGTPYRDPTAWVRSLDAMRALGAEHLVPSHTRPVSGADEIAGILTAYRDAIQLVHDQTVRAMNRGLGPDEIVARVRLPPHLAAHPWLQEVYGTVAWSARAVFAGQLGWFDGDAATLSPASPATRAAGYVRLAGGTAALLARAEETLRAGDAAFAAELVTHVLVLEPGHAAAARLKAAALRTLGQGSISPNGRNYFLTQALELEGAVRVALPPEAARANDDVIRHLPVARFIQAMPVRLDPDAAAEADVRLGFRFTDVGEEYGLHVRRGVAEVLHHLPVPADVVLETTTAVWKDVVTGRRNAAAAFATRDVRVHGSVLDLIRVLRMFQ